ncbi:hypothetical protein Tco_0290467 [Tanacetum coccineum]
MEYDTIGGSFDISPPRTTQAPPEGDWRIKSQEDREVCYDNSTKRRSRSGYEPLIKQEHAAARQQLAAVPTDGLHEADIPPSSSVPTDEFAGGSDVPAAATSVPASSGTTFSLNLHTSPEKGCAKGKRHCCLQTLIQLSIRLSSIGRRTTMLEALRDTTQEHSLDFEKQRAESLIEVMRNIAIADVSRTSIDLSPQEKTARVSCISAAKPTQSSFVISLYDRLQENPTLQFQKYYWLN